MNSPQRDAGYAGIKLTNLSVQLRIYNENKKKKTESVLTMIFSDQNSNAQVSPGV